MANIEKKKTVISKWSRVNVLGQKLQMVVYKWAVGKNKKGKTVYQSQTFHEVV